MRKAVIDVGSNSVLLLVAEKNAAGWAPIFETSKVTALGEGTRTSGLLGERGVTATLQALHEAYADAKSHGAEEIVAAATMAARMASNAADFLEHAKGQGTPLFVLSGEQEAELGFRAVADDPAFQEHDRLTITDVGGHSTEIVSAERTAFDWAIHFQKSFPIGTLALRENILSEEHPSPAALLSAAKAVDGALGLVFLPGQSGSAVTLGATGTNLVSIRERLESWKPEKVHGAWLTEEEVGRSVGWLSAMTDAQRAALVGIEPGREKTIHIGALILERTLNAIKTEGCFVSVRGWRFGLLTA